MLLGAGLGKVAASGFVQVGHAVLKHLGSACVTSGFGVQVFGQQGIDRIGQFFVGKQDPAHGHQGFAFGLVERLELERPHWRGRQRGHHAVLVGLAQVGAHRQAHDALRRGDAVRAGIRVAVLGIGMGLSVPACSTLVMNIAK